VCFTARGLGYLPGVLIGGKICDAFPQHGHRSMLLLLLVIAGMNALVPAAGSLPLLVAAFAVVGVSLGGVNTVLNAHMSWLWGAKLAPYMHAMHTAFALGAFIAPVLLGESFAIVSKEGGGASTASSGFRQHVARMGPPYWGVSVAMAVAALLLARAMPPERLGGGDVQQKQQKQREHCEPTRSEAGGCVVIPSEGSPADTEPPSTPQRPPLAAKVAPLSIDSDSTSASTASPVAVGSDERPTPLPCAFALGMLLFAYVGAEVGTGGWVLEYAIIRKLMTERRASYLVACFWGCLAAGRLASVFVSRCMTARTLLFGGICGCFVPLLVLAAAPDSVPAVWLAVGVYGFLLAPLFAAVMSLPVELGFKYVAL
jgi:fucose permease